MGHYGTSLQNMGDIGDENGSKRGAVPWTGPGNPAFRRCQS